MKTKTWPDSGFMPIAAATICDSPSIDFLMSTASLYT